MTFQEIREQHTLSLYGAILCVTHVLTAFKWQYIGGSGSDVMCFSFLQGCEPFTRLLMQNAKAVLYLYGALAVVNGILFMTKRTTAACWLFLALSVLKLVIHLSNYRLMGNFHYVSNVVNFAFILLPAKPHVIRLSLVLIYVAAGSIKFNSDWLTGASLIKPPFLHGKPLEIACAYAIVLELALVPLMLSGNRTVRGIVLAQLVAFHLFSWQVVGFFYPCLMLCLLTIFLLEKENFVFPKARSSRFAIGALVAAQIYPQITEPNSSLSGKARVVSLNMLDAWTVCETRFMLRYKNQTVEYAPRLSDGLVVRIQCDPIPLLYKAWQTCKSARQQADFVDADLDHQIRRKSQALPGEHLHFQNICTNPLSISPMGSLEQKASLTR